MKATSFIFKVASIVLAIGAAVCLILANLDRISDGLLSLREQLATKRKSCRCHYDDVDEYEDWDF